MAFAELNPHTLLNASTIKTNIIKMQECDFGEHNSSDKHKSSNEPSWEDRRRKEWEEWEEWEERKKRKKNEGDMKERTGIKKEDEIMGKEKLATIDRGINQIASILDSGLRIKQADGYHRMTRSAVSNYMNSHNVESINKETLFEFFGPNIYDAVMGSTHYFTHEICSRRYDIVKICKALEAAFPFLNPNIGDLNYDENYFQTFMFNYMYLGCNKLDEKIQILLIESLLELGFQYGLDPQFKTLSQGNTMWHYLCLGIDNFKVLEHVFYSLKNKEFDSNFANYENISILHYILAKVSNMYRLDKKDYKLRPSKSSIPIIYLNNLKIEEFKEINKKVDENYYSLLANYREADEQRRANNGYSEYVERLKNLSSTLSIDPLLYRFISKYRWIVKSYDMIDVVGEPVPLAVDVYYLSSNFSLRGYGTLDYFLEFYNRLYWDFSYNRDGVETINTLKRILKKEENKDNKE